MSPTKQQVLSVINQHPQGLTTAQLAEHFNAPSYNVSGVCSRLHAYGKIGRKPIEAPHRAVYAWLPKEARL